MPGSYEQSPQGNKPHTNPRKMGSGTSYIDLIIFDLLHLIKGALFRTKTGNTRKGRTIMDVRGNIKC